MNYSNIIIKSGCNCVPSFGPGAGVNHVFNFGRHTNGEKK